jgi:hypothetical protein
MPESPRDGNEGWLPDRRKKPITGHDLSVLGAVLWLVQIKNSADEGACAP